VANWRDYSPATRAALAALSRDSCFFPGCRTPILVFLGGRPEVNVEIVRIRGSDPGGPRHVAGLSAADANVFGNLLLLCVPHRKTIDREQKSHPAGLLETWRRGPPDALKDVGSVTEGQLDDLLTTAFSAARDQATEALSWFEQNDPEAARLIRQLIDGLHDHRGRDVGDQDVAGSLAQVARQFDSLGDDAAATLSRLEALVGRLESASKRINIGWSS
jgi:hypothetical protein